MPPAVEVWVLTTGPPGKSYKKLYYSQRTVGSSLEIKRFGEEKQGIDRLQKRSGAKKLFPLGKIVREGTELWEYWGEKMISSMKKKVRLSATRGWRWVRSTEKVWNVLHGTRHSWCIGSSELLAFTEPLVVLTPWAQVSLETSNVHWL